MTGHQLTVPADSEAPMAWGSDAMADVLRTTGVEFISLNPGASYRGLHDSIVNRLGNERPNMVLSLHEEHAVAIAHGYAKVSGKPMAVALHSNVGLMHGTMAIFNAFCDRVPMLILGAMGPWDAAERRPWIDWIHTTQDQAALVRQYVKWDDQPGSVAASLESLARANLLTRTYPAAPTYVVLDSALQEQALPDEIDLPDLQRHLPPAPPPPPAADVDRTLELILGAQRPVILIGRGDRDLESWQRRIDLVERLGATAVTDLKVGSMFPTGHPRHAGAPGYFLSEASATAVRGADLILALDWIDLGGTLRHALDGPPDCPVISCTCDFQLHNGWSRDHCELPPVDLAIAAHPDLLVAALLDRAPTGNGGGPAYAESSGPADSTTSEPEGGAIDMDYLGPALRAAVGDRDVTLARLSFGWKAEHWGFDHPLDCLGLDGGGGIGSGPGMAVGAALALRDGGRLPIAVIGDGDFLMGASALWTAAHMELPLLVVVANNGSYLNDEVHQERVAKVRDRPVENRWVGQRIGEPRPDLAEHARSLGLQAWGPVKDRAELPDVLARAVAASATGPVVVDVRIGVELYSVGEHAAQAKVGGGAR